MQLNKVIRSLKSSTQNAFSLLEVIIVLALIGALATVILPNLHISSDSEVSTSLRSLTNAIRTTYDNSIISGEMRRMVFNLRTGEYWVEKPPPYFTGRPANVDLNNSESLLVKDSKAQLYQQLIQEEKNLSGRATSSSTPNNPVNYSIRNMMIIQKNVLLDQIWLPIENSFLHKEKLIGSVVFYKIISGANKKIFSYTALAQNDINDNKNLAYLYFLPNGSTSQFSLQIALRSANRISILKEGPKFTLNVDTLTGQSFLFSGFLPPNFSLAKVNTINN